MRAWLSPLAALAICGCVTTAASTIPPTAARLTAQFEAVAFGSDFDRLAGVLVRWTQAPYLRLVSRDHAMLDGHRDDLAEAAAIVARASGAVMRFDPDNATLVVVFGPRTAYGPILSQVAAALPDGEREHILTAASGSRCFGVFVQAPDTPGVIEQAVVLIDADSGAAARRACIHQELIQVAGLPADACRYRPSVFCEADFPQTATPADRVLLRTLYDPRLRPGMSRAEAMPIARRIIAELWKE